MDAIRNLLVGWEQIGYAIGRDANRLLLVTLKRPSGYHIVFLFANEEANSVTILRIFELMVDTGAIEVEFADEFGLELYNFEFDNHVSAQLEVIEKQVGFELIPINCKDLLASYKSKSVAKFKEKLDNILLERKLKVLLLIVLVESKKAEVVRVFENIASKIGIGFWQIR